MNLAQGIPFAAKPDHPAPVGFEWPVDDLLDVINPDGTVRWANGAQASALGHADGALAGLGIEAIYTPDAVAWIRAQFLRSPPATSGAPAELLLRHRDGWLLRVLAKPLPRLVPHAPLTLKKQLLGDLATRLARLETENELLRRIADAGNEAHWCIEFALPIDLALPVDEIVHRVFTHPSYWRLCNQAMSRLYGLPHHLDLCDQGVRTYWPRDPENEAFVRQIISAGYSIDGALSVDTRHDGRRIRVENDVRADIEDGQLRRLWGSCRCLDDTGGMDA